MYVILYYVYVIIYVCVCDVQHVLRMRKALSRWAGLSRWYPRKAFFPAPRSTQSFNRPCRPRVHVHHPSRTLARTFGSICTIYIYTVVGHDQAPKRKCQFSPPRAGRMVVIAVEVPDFRHISCLPVLWPAYLIIADSKLHAKDYSNQTLSAMAWLLSVTTCVVLA